jgi:hypothetical protein
MSRIFLALVLLVACVAGLGFYLGWFQVASDGTEGKTHITLTVDKEKIKADEQKALDTVHNVGHTGTGKAAATTTEKGDDPIAPPVQPPPNQE